MRPVTVIAVLVAAALIAGCASGSPPTTRPASPNPDQSAVPTASRAPTASPAPTPLPAPTASPAPSPVARVCAGREAAHWPGLPKAADRYLAAWNERDPRARLAILDEIWAEDATYFDALASGPISGRAAMSNNIAELQGAPGIYFEPREWAEGDAHHGHLQMRWRACAADGPTGVEGTEYAQLDAEGRISLAVGFSPLSADDSGVENAPATDICAGRDSFDWSYIPEAVRLYGDAWNAQNGDERREILDEVWAEDGVYVDSFAEGPAVGRSGIKFVMDFGMVPSNYIELRAWSDADWHDGWFHARWRDCCPTGAVFLEGTEIGVIDEDGRLRQVTSFWEDMIECQAAECRCEQAA